MANGFWSDIYVLIDSRAKNTIENFLNKYLMEWKEYVDEYAVPQFSDNPKMIFKHDFELMDYCEKNTNAVQTIYWSNKKDVEPQQAMVFYTDDNKMILGLSVDNEGLGNKYLNDMKLFLNSDYGYITYGNPAPNNSKKFIKIMNKYNRQIASQLLYC